MVRINLRRIMSKPEVKSQISCILELDGAAVAVCDQEGRLLLGEAEALKFKAYPLLHNEILLGKVYGGRSARAVSGLLNYVCAAEFEKKALGQDTLEKYKEITVLYDVAAKLAGKLDTSEAVSLIAGEVKRLIKADSVSVMFYLEKEGRLELAAALDDGIDSMTFKKGQGIAGNVILTGRAEIINDVDEDPRFIEGNSVIKSMMCAPLIVRDKCIGVINVSSKEAHNYSANDLKILSVLSSQAAISVENARLYKNLKEAFVTTVYTLAETIEKRDPYTGGHTKRVTDYSVAIGEALGLPADEIERLSLGAILHDIGKIGVRDDVLLKESTLSDEEFGKMKQHTLYGQEILDHVDYLQYIIPAIRHHHERYDGGGYPDRIRGEEIDFIARIIAVADSYDAMTTDRPYRKALSTARAVKEIRNNSGSQFDPAVVEAFEATCRLGRIDQRR